MRLWKMELRRLLDRPVLNLGLLMILAFQVLVFCTEVSNLQTEIDGNLYRGAAAVQADRELAQEYEGILTMEKVEDIIGRFGFSGYVGGWEGGPRVREGNFCSQWVTDCLTDFYQTREKPTALVKGKFWNEHGKYYLESQVRFGYTGGWTNFHSIWSWSVLILNIWLVLMAVPVFSEEYGRKTVQLLLTTVHGRWKDIWAKIAAVFTLGIAAYFLMTGLLLCMTAEVYGIGSLEISAGMFDYRALFTEGGSMTVGEHLLLTFCAKLAAVCLNLCVTLFVSSKCRSTVLGAVLRLIALYPLAWLINEVVYGMLFQMVCDNGMIHELWVWITMDVLGIACSSTTYYLSWSAFIGTPSYWPAVLVCVLASVMAGCIWRAVVNYRKGQ